MDYEKKYNEALERARALWREAIEKEYVEDYLKDYETIFPELRESEDERFRNYILRVCKECIEANDKGLELSMGTTKKLLAYLEKQGQKQTDLPSGFYYIDLNGNRYYSKEFRYGDIKLKVGEQKPAEKQDYSGLNDLERAILRGFLCAGVENVPVEIIKDTASECIGFLALIEPDAWSEEDKKMLLSIVNAFRNGTVSTIGQEQWLKSLRPDTFQNGNSRPKTSDNWKPAQEQEEPEYYQHFDPDC